MEQMKTMKRISALDITDECRRLVVLLPPFHCLDPQQTNEGHQRDDEDEDDDLHDASPRSPFRFEAVTETARRT